MLRIRYLLSLIALLSISVASAADEKVFVCDEGRTRLDPSCLSDDYCDCLDGSDEPLTAACAGRIKAQFVCNNAGYLAVEISSSLVDDGVCDCCDGSDESRVVCPSRCDSTAAEYIQREEAEISRYEAGLALKEKLAQSVHDQVKVVARRLRKAHSETDQVFHTFQQLRNARAAPEAINQVYLRFIQRRSQYESLHAIITSYLGDAGEHLSVYGKCFDFVWEKQRHGHMGTEVDRYDIMFCPFQNVTQTDGDGQRASLGSFAGWLAPANASAASVSTVSASAPSGSDSRIPNTMLYQNGDRCWNGPERSTQVRYLCGVQHSILSMTEDGKCQYAIEFASPLACDSSVLEQKKLQLAQHRRIFNGEAANLTLPLRSESKSLSFANLLKAASTNKSQRQQLNQRRSKSKAKDDL